MLKTGEGMFFCLLIELIMYCFFIEISCYRYMLCLNQIRRGVWKFGPAYINELQQNLLRNKHAKHKVMIYCVLESQDVQFYFFILKTLHCVCFLYKDCHHFFLLQCYISKKKIFNSFDVYENLIIGTIFIFVVKVNISVSLPRISWICLLLV